jgi:hypothetical protein
VKGLVVGDILLLGYSKAQCLRIVGDIVLSIQKLSGGLRLASKGD